MNGRLLLCALSLIGMLSACSSGDSGSASETAPAASPPAAPPAGFTERSLGPVSFATPQDWQPIPSEAAAGVEELTLREPAPQSVSAAAVVALFQLEPTRTAAQEADSTVRIKRDVQRAQNVRSQTISLPGFTNAVQLSYDEVGPTGELLHTEAVVGDVARGGLLALNVVATPANFEAKQLAAITRSISASSG